MTVAKAKRTPVQSPGRTTGQFGVVVFLASDVMLFAPLFAAYFLLRSTTEQWPPEGVELEAARALAATVVLVATSFTLIARDRAHERSWMSMIGVAVVASQVLLLTRDTDT